MKARIYRPAKNAMQSGSANTREWVLEFEPETGKTIDNVMGWTGSSDMRGQVKLHFDTLDDAKGYAERNKLPFDVKPEHRKKRRIQAYSDNFK
ncbi:ETC complex I subunit [Kordiimonas aquimaris]|uniref:ETC complex I subunit n=1 Tax=Kordiimonas aquimaris TaxID=707591 RepID=UPI0021D21858|nr:ETC complex I subunit [Kordiimonas aquimaris]